jgi:hypothetical protein
MTILHILLIVAKQDSQMANTTSRATSAKRSLAALSVRFEARKRLAAVFFVQNPRVKKLAKEHDGLLAPA